MTVQATTRRAGPTIGNSAATVFPFAFKVFVAADLQVMLQTLASGAQAVLVLNDPLGYSVVLNVDQNANPGGSVTYNPLGVPMPNTQSLTITSVVPQVQGTHIINGGAFFANNVEDAIDRVLINLQDLTLNVGNSIRFPTSDSVALNAILPSAASRANQGLLFDNLGNVVVGAIANAPISSAWQPVVAAATLAAGRTAMGFSAYFDSLIAAATKAAFDALISPLTTKGDLWVFGAADTRLPVGANGKAAIADSTQATGIDWKTVFNDSAQTSVATAATCNVFAALTSVLLLTGTTDITSFDAAATLGQTRLCRVESTGARLVNGANLINPLPFDIQLMAGDNFFVVSMGGNTSRVVDFQRGDGQKLLGGRIPFGVFLTGMINAPASATNYCCGAGVIASAETSAHVVIPEACTFSELRLLASAALAGGTAVATLRKNSADTALTCTLAAASGTTASDTTHTVDFSAGDFMSLKLVTGAIGATTDFGFSAVVKKRGMSVGVPMQFCFNSQNISGAAVSIFKFSTAGGEADAEFPVPPCRIVPRSPMRGDSGTVGTIIGPSLRKNANFPNGSSDKTPLASGGPNITNLRCLAGPPSDFAESDLYNARGVTTDSDAQFNQGWFDALGASDLQYNHCLLNFLCYQQVQALSRFAGPYVGSGTSWQSATETDVQVPMPACTLRNLRVVSSTIIAATTTVVTIRKNGVDTGLTCTLTTAGRLASDLVNSVTFAAGDILTVKVVSGATAGTRTYNITIEANPL